MNEVRAADDADLRTRMDADQKTGFRIPAFYPHVSAPQSASSAARTFCFTGFLPSKHGFPFPNHFSRGTPVFHLPTPFGRLPIGDAGGGLCGGMVFAALDFFLAGIPAPRELTPPLFGYLGRRLLDSWNLPFGVLKYYDWQRRPSGSRFLAGERVLAGVSWLTIVEEWPKVRAVLEAGLPVPLGLVNVHSLNPSPWVLARNHQVLATGYELEGDTLTLRIYDPNYPNDDTAALRLELSEPDRGRPVIHTCEGPTARGFFLAEYRKDHPPG